MTDLPNGTVTFLFTDIDGSTRLLNQLGEGYAIVLEDHRRILRAAIVAHDGREVGTRGDGFFVAFGRASDALAAVAEAQCSLASHDWLGGLPVRVRMGLHTGEALLAEGDYVGLDVHRAARLCEAGHGGQVLLSDATRTLVEPMLPAGVGLLDLGQHRLKDLQRPEHVFQLLIEGLPAEFPPLRTLDARPNNLPVPVTTLVGRQWEVAEVTRLLLRDDVRLLTLTGPGGVGKTRLAIEAARKLAEDRRLAVAFAELAPIADPALVPHAIAGAIGVRERVDRPLLETLAEASRPARLLLVLDNCAHLAAVCAAPAPPMRRRPPAARRWPARPTFTVSWPGHTQRPHLGLA